MYIKRIQVLNFKSFKKIDVSLNKFNIIIGANASGKSNFVQVIQFIRDIVDMGVENAVYMQGGYEYLKNIFTDSADDVSIKLELESDKKKGWIYGQGKKEYAIELCGVSYEFKLHLNSGKKDSMMNYEKLEYNCDVSKIKDEHGNKIDNFRIILLNENGKKSYTIEPKKFDYKKYDLFPDFLMEKEFIEAQLAEKESLLEKPIIIPPFFFELSGFLKQIAIFDIDPKLSKKASIITGKKDLESDGKNLAIVLKHIIDDEEEWEKLTKLIKDVLPFIDDLHVEKSLDKSLIASLRETYSKSTFFPAPLISDGTINILILIIILYFEEKPVIVIEEPERNIHPHLISKIVNMMKDVSSSLKKQIFITTHNPMFIRYGDIKDILLVSRNDKGYSEISRPVDKEEVKVFLNNNLGIDELFVNNLLK